MHYLFFLGFGTRIVWHGFVIIFMDLVVCSLVFIEDYEASALPVLFEECNMFTYLHDIHLKVFS